MDVQVDVEDYRSVRRGAFLDRLVGALVGRRNTLVALAEAKEGEVCYGQRYVGTMQVPLSAISGSVDRSQDFDRDFRPRGDHTRQRWVRVNQAFASNVSLPPVSLNKFGDFYFVKDGHHRISVARYRGAQYIDAEVTEFFAQPH
ncbi:MAG: hypothetical protein M3441_12115 [Chloroflexota bacterium]|nr:hypothetical protein [Chloroflexota bacterium]